MSLLKNLTTSDDIQQERDSLGGARLLDTDIYPMTITMAYLKKSDGGALALNVHMKTEDNIEHRAQFWMTSGDKKGNKNYYEDKNGEKQYLPGFNQANAIALLAVGKEISELDTEDKSVSLYDSKAKAEVPTKVPVVMDLLQKEITVAMHRQTVDKTAKDEASGEYLPTGESREENEIDKIFRTRDMMTVAEIRGQAEKATFHETWLTKNKGQVRDKRSKGTTTTPGKTGGAPGAGATSAKKPAQSLFS